MSQQLYSDNHAILVLQNGQYKPNADIFCYLYNNKMAGQFHKANQISPAN